jgi:hypothetical protein
MTPWPGILRDVGTFMPMIVAIMMAMIMMIAIES